MEVAGGDHLGAGVVAGVGRPFDMAVRDWVRRATMRMNG